jgi:cellulose biosynthesis protein BcsQ
MKTVMVASMKGGPGKTTTTLALSAAWATAHAKDVVIYDSDPQGTVTRQMRHVTSLSPWTEDPVPVGIPQMAPRAKLFRGGRALLFANEPEIRHFVQRPDWRPRLSTSISIIDTPPGGILHILAAAEVADLLLVPVDTTPLGLEGLIETIGLLKVIKPPIPTRVLLTRMMGRRKLITAEIIDFLDSEHPGLRLDIGIPEDARVPESHAARRPVTLGPRGRASEAYHDVATHLLKVMRGLRHVPHVVDRSGLATGLAA